MAGETVAAEMTAPAGGHHVILFYKYVEVVDPEASNTEQDAICRRLGLVGRILISEEGINATLSSPSKQHIDEYIAFLCNHEVFAMKPEDFKHSFHAAAAAPFIELIIKYVREIVSTGGVVDRPNMNASDEERGYLTPQQFHEAMQDAVKDKENTVVLDVRAHKEFLVGHFENAIDPEVKNFSEYYAFLQNRLDEMKNKKVLMYCTGGIRCEKASNFLRSKGLEDVHHLKGGIHKYLEAYEDGGFFKGKNFVFDKRVLMGAQNSEVVGKCIECKSPYDEFNGRKVCSVCRDLVLVCDSCFSERHGEVHCTDHQYLKHCYVTFLQYLPREELLEHQVALEAIYKQFAVEKGWKNKRRSIRNQINKIDARIKAIDANPEEAQALCALRPRPIHCRTCGLATCAGNCWGFWNDFPGQNAEATAAQPTQPFFEMVGKKQATKKKAAAGGVNAVDAAPTDLAAKKKHVRDLAKAGRWQEVRLRLCDPADAEKNKAKHTPQSLAQEILAKNGYRSPSPVKKVTKQLRMETPDVVAPVVIEVSPDTLTEAQKQQIEKRRREALERRNRKLTVAPAPVKPANKPVDSIAQHDLREKYPQAIQNGFVNQRQQIHAHQAGTSKSSSDALRQHPTKLKNKRTNLHQVAPIPDYSVQTDMRILGPNTSHHQSITTSGVTLSKNQASLFLDELEAAADIVNWEKEQLASEDPVHVHEISPDEYVGASSASKWEARNSKVWTGVNERFPISDEIAAAADIAKWEEKQKQQLAILDELAAAMEIVQWEEEQPNRGVYQNDLGKLSDDLAAAADIVNWELDQQHELHGDSKSAIVTDDDDPEYDRPHFQLLGTTSTTPKSSHGSSVTPIRTTSVANQPGYPKASQQLSSAASHKRKKEPATEYLEKQQETNPRRIAPSSSPVPAHSRAQQSPQDLVDQNRQAVDTFIKKHSLADKFDVSVLDFVEMMLK